MNFSHVIRSFQGNPIVIWKNIIWRVTAHKSTEPHIFVVGAPRSGTTLVKSILCAHPKLQGLKYETTTFLSYRNLFNKERHQRILSAEKFDFHDFEVILEKSKNVVELYDYFAKEYISNSSAERFVEKTNSPAQFRLRFIINRFPNSKIIHVFRDGRDCYCSAKHHPNVGQGRKLESYAHHWKDCINARLNYDQHPQIFDLRYEDLTSEPTKTIGSMMNFLDETFDTQQTDPSFYGNPLLAKSTQHQNLTKPIDASSQYRWRKEMQKNEILKFQRIAGSQLQRLDYEILRK